MIRTAVYGASGYGGAELLRLLLSHPDVELVQATSREPGRALTEVHPQLRGLTDLTLSPSDPDALRPDLQAVFFSLPHGESLEAARRVEKRCPEARLIDLAQDFRTGHEADGWVYGLPEFSRAALPAARKVACPGCFATSILLGTCPALRHSVLPRHVIIDAKTGSSGSGASPSALTHHPMRASTHKAYKVFSHQHEEEIRAAWTRLVKNAGVPGLHFVPQSTPLVRGIHTCGYLVYDAEAPTELPAMYAEAYRGSPFVRVVSEPPNVNSVRGTNNADVYLQAHGEVQLVICTIDNLVRGAAGQAVQCMNLAFELPEQRGLRLAGWTP